MPKLMSEIGRSLVYDLVPVGLNLVLGDILKFFSDMREKRRDRPQLVSRYEMGSFQEKEGKRAHTLT